MVQLLASSQLKTYNFIPILREYPVYQQSNQSWTKPLSTWKVWIKEASLFLARDASSPNRTLTCRLLIGCANRKRHLGARGELTAGENLSLRCWKYITWFWSRCWYTIHRQFVIDNWIVLNFELIEFRD